MDNEFISYITILIGVVGLYYARKSANKGVYPRPKPYTSGIKRRR